MQASTTITVLDKQQERKELMLEINELKAEKESIKREVHEYESARSALTTEFKDVVDLSELRNAVFENTIKGRLKKNIDELEEKIAKFTKEQEKYNTSIKELKNINEQLTGEVNQKNSYLLSIKSDLEKFLAEYKSSKSILVPEIERLKIELSNLQQLNKEEKAKNELFKEDFLQKKKFILDEEKRLSTKAQDLHIYEARLRKHCLELWPELEIVV
jgi:chromosome segregation ATPase